MSGHQQNPARQDTEIPVSCPKCPRIFIVPKAMQEMISVISRATVRDSVGAQEEMEYSTWQDIGQTRSRSAEMMARYPLET